MSLVCETIARALAAQGAVVETVGDDLLEMVAPAEVRTALGVPEFTVLAFGGQCPAGAVRFTLESDWAERLAGLLGTRGRFLAPTKSLGPVPEMLSAPDEVLRKRLCFLNATHRFVEAQPAWTSYLLLVFRYAAISDEQREDLFAVCVNESNGANADHLVEPLLERLRMEDPAEIELAAGAASARAWTPAVIRDWCANCVPNRIRSRLEPFLAGMRRRMAKDLDQLHAYHADLLREAENKTRKRKGAQQHAADGSTTTAMKIQAIKREYQAKVADLGRKYAMNVRVELAQGLRIMLPVQRLAFAILRRKGKRDFWLDWNAVSRHLDALACEACGAPTTAHSICDDRLHVVCAVCAQACPACGKAYCHACHPHKCPACGGRSDTAVAPTAAGG